jgi:ABC-type nitrate/sulfonate/bicarbonate transport system substrate-binding protein
MHRAAPRRPLGSVLLAVALGGLACAPGAAPTATKPAAPPANPPAQPAAPAQPAGAPAQAATPAPPRAPIPFTVGVPVAVPAMIHLTFYVAQDEGYYNEAGLNVELKNFDGGVQSLRGSIAGSTIDVAGTSSEVLANAVARGATIKGIGSYGPRLSVVMAAQPELKSVADLRGKRIGATGGIGAFGDSMSRAVLATGGLKPEDTQYQPLSTGARVSALLTGQVDTSILHVDQYYKALEQKPDLSLIAKLWDVLPTWWFGANIATDAALAENREAYVAFQQAVTKAGRLMYQNRERAIEIGVKHTGNGREAVEKAYDDLAAAGAWAVNDGMPRELIEATIGQQMDMGLIEGRTRPTFEQIADRAVAEDAVRRLGGPWTGDPRWY